jgi:hypothetical protein
MRFGYQQMIEEPMPEPQPAADNDSQEAARPVECAVELMADQSAQRLWIRALIPLLQSRAVESDSNGRVQFAYDLMHIAACERIARILRSDISSNNADT